MASLRCTSGGGNVQSKGDIQVEEEACKVKGIYSLGGCLVWSYLL